jgi:hypothetical protein
MNSVLSDRSYEGGILPVDAGRIEKRLAEVWSLATHTGEQGQDPVKLCLANIVVICDGLTRPEAELLTAEIAHEHPSRVILTVIDEDLKAYYAFVRTSCTRDPDTGTVRCWEIIELVSETAKLHSVVGALRSLLVDSVPVVTIDFRPFHSTPELDNMMAELSDMVLVNTDIVSTGHHEKPFLPLRWYRTLPIRLLIGDLFNLLGGHTVPARFIVLTQAGVDTLDDLVAGWLMSRLAQAHVPADPHGRPDHEIEIVIQERQKKNRSVVTVEFEDKSEPALIEIDEARSGVYHLIYRGQTVTRSVKDWPLASYIVGVLLDSSESREYAAVADMIAARRNRK